MTSGRIKILITGGAGFVGSVTAMKLKAAIPESEITVMDNLYRRGSEANVGKLQEKGIIFHFGDIRVAADFPKIGQCLVIDCSAEPSVLAGYTSSPKYLLDTNLTGAINCLEYCRETQSSLIFLSTSRVYSVEPLSALAYTEAPTRLVLSPTQKQPGASAAGINEEFATSQFRSLYGTTKLTAEYLIEEYRRAYKLCAVINRCGVITGPGQMGKGDQGIFAYWMGAHATKTPLRYIGFNGSGKQVRDLLDARDLAELILEQATDIRGWDGSIVNVGGGVERSLSLRECTELCRDISGNNVEIQADSQPRPMDIPIYISDCRKLFEKTTWRPQISIRQTFTDIFNSL